MELGGTSAISGLANTIGQAATDSQIVTKTLDKLNQNTNTSSGLNSDYDMQKSVLAAAYTGKGTALDTTV